MEEYVGQLWDKVITGAAERRSAAAAVTLDEVAPSLAVYFRALGGDPGLTITAAQPTYHGARRSFLQKIAGSGEKVALSWADKDSLRLPPKIDVFEEKALNRDLYFWLAAIATVPIEHSLPWIVRNQEVTLRTLTRFPGLANIYRRLVTMLMALRPNPAGLEKNEAAQERAIRQALEQPGSVKTLPEAKRRFYPVLLWTHPFPPVVDLQPAGRDDPAPTPATAKSAGEKLRRKFKAERTQDPEDKHGFLLMFRAESIFSWAEYTKVNRSQEDEDDPETAKRAAEDMDFLTVASQGETSAARVKFDLDLPASEDVRPLGDGVPLPEWHWKKRIMQADYCRLQEVITPNVTPIELPPALRRTAKTLCRQFQALVPTRQWLNAEPDGEEIDLNAWVRVVTDMKIGGQVRDQGVFRALVNKQRDLACLVLADLSLSTDSYVSNTARAIDVIQDSLLLFSEALKTTGDPFALYGFSSLRRDRIHFHQLKSFDDAYDGLIRGRIAAIKPGYYTRMGAAIRHASTILAKQKNSQRILLLLTDGKPNDIDQYEGRYGIEDTRVALLEARKMGLRPFCVTIDTEASDYLPHLMGSGNYVVIRKPEELPKTLALLYAQLTR